ncbi:MAG: hypothetical protein FWH07_01265 [Oscillospiraceae bacterium]|nr:hypothetical protein [Oscillospiraceae bacterium]
MVHYQYNDAKIIERLSGELARNMTLTELLFASKNYDSIEEFRSYIENLLAKRSCSEPIDYTKKGENGHD